MTTGKMLLESPGRPSAARRGAAVALAFAATAAAAVSSHAAYFAYSAKAPRMHAAPHAAASAPRGTTYRIAPYLVWNGYVRDSLHFDPAYGFRAHIVWEAQDGNGRVLHFESGAEAVPAVFTLLLYRDLLFAMPPASAV